MVRHFTATGFVVHRRSVALHWHRKVGAWLPAGGHIEPNEDPVQAVLREVSEETGMEVRVAATSEMLGLSYPKEVTPPYTIMVEDIDDPVDGFHQHIDMIYFCRPLSESPCLYPGWRWVSADILESGAPLKREGTSDNSGCGNSVPPPEDVRALGIRAIEWVERIAQDGEAVQGSL